MKGVFFKKLAIPGLFIFVFSCSDTCPYGVLFYKSI